MPKIQKITCHKILNSRADWTIETHVKLDDGSVGIHTVPEGASKGENEALSIPADRAVEMVSTVLNDALVGNDPFNQKQVDHTLIKMDGTENKKSVGANSILSVSLAVTKAAAISKHLELWEYVSFLYSGKIKKKINITYPTPLFNVINGGKHADNDLSFQEFMVIPSRDLNILQAIEAGVTVYDDLKQKLVDSGLDVDVGDEGGFAPNGFTADKALSFLKDAASKSFTVGKDIFFGMDAAAETFYKDGKYIIPEDNLNLSSQELSSYYQELFKKYELIYLEDPFYEKDITAWEEFNKQQSSRLMVVADDLVVTNPRILQGAIDKKLANAVIVKPNQVGTLTETLKFIQMAKDAKMSVIVSHRSGDTAEDTFIADLGVAVDAEFIKSGAPSRGERIAKYNRLLEIFNA